MWGQREPLVKLAILAAVGYIVGLPVLVWCLRDLKHFHRPLWVGYGNRDAWRNGAVIAYMLGGWPVLALAFGWRTGRMRAELIDERDRLK